MPDDIPRETTTSQTERAFASTDEVHRRKIGPESEVRGGSEATQETLDDDHRDPR